MNILRSDSSKAVISQNTNWKGICCIICAMSFIIFECVFDGCNEKNEDKWDNRAIGVEDIHSGSRKGKVEKKREPESNRQLTIITDKK